MLGEKWYPVKVDLVYRATLSPEGPVVVSKEATEAVAHENGVRIERIHWLSRATDKMYGLVVMFLTHQHEAAALSAKGTIWRTLDYKNDDRSPHGATSVTNTVTRKLGAGRPGWYAVEAHKLCTCIRRGSALPTLCNTRPAKDHIR